MGPEALAQHMRLDYHSHMARLAAARLSLSIAAVAGIPSRVRSAGRAAGRRRPSGSVTSRGAAESRSQRSDFPGAAKDRPDAAPPTGPMPNAMLSILLDAIRDTAAMVPLLLLVYLAIAWFESREAGGLTRILLTHARAGPALGATLGVIPQCGFSVIAATLYAQGAVTVGTLLAVLISTSDEAIPVLLAQPRGWPRVLPLLATKLGLGLTVGYLVDAVVRRRRRAAGHPAESWRESWPAARPEPGPPCGAAAYRHSSGCASAGGMSQASSGLLVARAEDAHHPTLTALACCGHEIGGRPRRRELMWHALIHTAKTAGFVLAITAVFGFAAFGGASHLPSVLARHGWLQPVAAAMVGMIPNCAASVAIAEMYLRGTIGFGAAIAGLSSGCGLGSLVLVKENPDRGDTLRILALLFFTSVAAGLLLRHLLD